ncbi:MAG TPA: PAS domain S-box protein [Candidatus Hydrogenedentes bacterium]|nr:PAS domain S-box protein [Candidatus Hydrogenedentota bacterium]HPG66773.1 PAS domain S-box protein [Candidatus Hydrogenedentota bacterium]
MSEEGGKTEGSSTVSRPFDEPFELLETADGSGMPWRKVSRARNVLEIAIFASLYFSAARLGLVVSIGNEGTPPVWCAAGVAFAGVLLRGYRVSPGIMIGMFLAGIMAFLDRGFGLGATIVASGAIAVGNTLEAVLGVYLVRRLIGPGRLFQTAKNVFKYVAYAALFPTVLGAMAGVGVLAVLDEAFRPDWRQLWLSWWTGNALQVLLSAPFVLIWVAQWRISWTFRRAVEWTVVFGAAVGVSWFTFRAPELLPAGLTYRLEYLGFPLVGYAAFRFGHRGAVSTTAFVAAIAGYYTVRGIGPFVIGSPATSLVLLQVYQALIAVTSLTFSAALAERKRAEAQVQSSERRFRTLFESSNDAIVVCDYGGRIRDVNARMVEMVAVPRAAILDTYVIEWHPEAYRADQRAHFTELVQQGHCRFESVLRRGDGSLVDVEISARAAGLGSGLIQGLIRDITERKCAEQVLQRREAILSAVSFAAERYLRTASWRDQMAEVLARLGAAAKVSRVCIFERHNAPDGTSLISLRIEWNVWADTTVAPEELVHQNVPWEHSALSTLAEGRPLYGAVRDFAGADREVLSSRGIKSIAMVPIFAGDTWWGFMGYDDCVAEREWSVAEIEALQAAANTLGAAVERERSQEQRRLLAAAIEQAEETVMITDLDETILYVNPAFARVSGYAIGEALGRKPYFLESGEHDEAFFEDFYATIRRGDVWHGRFINRHKDGHLFEEDTTVSGVRDAGGAITHYVAVKRDVTNEIHLERRLQQAQKMEAIGTLAGGIAHDLNNILAVIFAYTDMAQNDLQPGTFAHDHFGRFLRAGRRAQDLVKQILTFSRQGDSERKPIRMDLIVREALQMLRSTMPSTIRIMRAIERDSCHVFADPTQIHQVVMNLCTNAYQSMLHSGGTIEVRLNPFRVDAAFASAHPRLHEGDYVEFVVRDTGCGMDAATQERVFDPFFTTKPVGQGTGLGLSTVHGIVTGLNGDITVSSVPGEGTTFRVYLPQYAGADADAIEDVGPPPSGHGERVLLVDDEPDIVDLGEMMLRNLGYDVRAFADSEKALEALQATPYQFDLLLTDHLMPKVTGAELARHALMLRPNMPVIVATGFAELLPMEQAKAMGVREHITKPFSVSELGHLIHRALDRVDHQDPER